MPVKEKAAKAKKPSAFMKPVKPSAALAEIVGKGPMPRTEVTQKLWAYIRKHNRQNPKNKKQILPDEKLEKVLGKKPVDMFEMTRLVSKHLSS